MARHKYKKNASIEAQLAARTDDQAPNPSDTTWVQELPAVAVMLPVTVAWPWLGPGPGLLPRPLSSSSVLMRSRMATASRSTSRRILFRDRVASLASLEQVMDERGVRDRAIN